MASEHRLSPAREYLLRRRKPRIWVALLLGMISGAIFLYVRGVRVHEDGSVTMPPLRAVVPFAPAPLVEPELYCQIPAPMDTFPPGWSTDKVLENLGSGSDAEIDAIADQMAKQAVLPLASASKSQEDLQRSKDAVRMNYAQALRYWVDKVVRPIVEQFERDRARVEALR